MDGQQSDQRDDADWTWRGVSAWDGSTWTNFTRDDLPKMSFAGYPIPSLIASGDGSVWLARGRQVVRFNAGAWTTHDVADLGSSATLSAVGDDGRLWFVPEVPGADDVVRWGATVLPGPGYVLAATHAGLYRLGDGSWQRLGLSTPSGSFVPESGLFGDVTALAASSRDEVWVTAGPADGAAARPAGDGLFRFDGTDWRRQRLPVEATAGQAIVGADGGLWVATSSGPLVRRNGAWTRRRVLGVRPDRAALRAREDQDHRRLPHGR